MTADIRTAAQREAERLMPIVGHDPMDFARSVAQDSFAKGAVWAQARVTPTREQVAERIARTMPGWNDDTEDGELTEHWERVNRACLEQGRTYADAVLALMAGLAEGESSE